VSATIAVVLAISLFYWMCFCGNSKKQDDIRRSQNNEKNIERVSRVGPGSRVGNNRNGGGSSPQSADAEWGAGEKAPLIGRGGERSDKYRDSRGGGGSYLDDVPEDPNVPRMVGGGGGGGGALKSKSAAKKSPQVTKVSGGGRTQQQQHQQQQHYYSDDKSDRLSDFSIGI